MTESGTTSASANPAGRGAIVMEIPCAFTNPCQHGGHCHREKVVRYLDTAKEEREKPKNDANRFSAKSLSSAFSRGNTTTTTTTTTTAPRKREEVEVVKCDCPSIWKGDFCEEFNPCFEEKCHKGRCRPVNTTHSECACNPGWTGELCDIDIDECDPSPCEYDAPCTDLENDFNCSCPLGTDGKRCEINFDDCAHGDKKIKSVCATRDKDAVCEDGLNEFTCTCSSEWIGENCTMRRIIWEVITMFDDTNVDIVGVTLGRTRREAFPDQRFSSLLPLESCKSICHQLGPRRSLHVGLLRRPGVGRQEGYCEVGRGHPGQLLHLQPRLTTRTLSAKIRWRAGGLPRAHEGAPGRVLGLGRHRFPSCLRPLKY
uniref:EGF-like domain-containing protein n=1 Tax=Steinernema glaseri TaxID=37863 RepID=A0A1I7YEK9_9BILA